MKTYHYTHRKALIAVGAAVLFTTLFRYLLGRETELIGEAIPVGLVVGALLYVYNYWYLFNESIEMGHESFTHKKRIGRDREFPYADVKRVTVVNTAKEGWLAKWEDDDLIMKLADRTGGASEIRLSNLDDYEDFVRRIRNGVEHHNGNMLFLDGDGDPRMSLKELVREKA